jgi:hypothetical protein
MINEVSGGATLKYPGGGHDRNFKQKKSTRVKNL